MSAWRTTYHIVRADLLDRLREYRFLLTLGVTVCAAYVFVPPADAGYVTLAFGAYRGVYNSAFSGAMLSLLTVSILSLLGFYVVRGSIERDRRTGIGNMVAVSPVRTTHYLIAKTVSHFVVLVVMVTVVLAAAIPMQVWRGESGQLDLVALSAPFVWIVLPAMAVVAALSVLFDLVGPLRGSFGNVLYFFLWGGMTTAARFGVSGPAVLRPVGEFFGFTLLWPPIAEACQQAFGDCSIDQLSMGIIPVPEGIVLAGVLSGPVIVRAALTGDLAAFVAHAVAALFVPTLALAFGVLSGGRVLFEVAYGLLWFVSLQADIPPLLDFMARGQLRTASAWVTPLYAGVTALLLALALWGRRRQMTG